MKNTTEYDILEHLKAFLMEGNPAIIALFPGYPDTLNPVYRELDKRENDVYVAKYLWPNNKGTIEYKDPKSAAQKPAEEKNEKPASDIAWPEAEASPVIVNPKTTIDDKVAPNENNDKINFNGNSVFMERGVYSRIHTDPPEITEYLKSAQEEIEERIQNKENAQLGYNLNHLDLLDENKLRELTGFLLSNPKCLLAFAKTTINIDISSNMFETNENYRKKVYKYYNITNKLLKKTIEQVEGTVKSAAEHLLENLKYNGRLIMPYFTKDCPNAQKNNSGQMIPYTQVHPDTQKNNGGTK